MKLLYALLCILFPLLWGVVVARLFDLVERRGGPRGAGPEDIPEIEYYI